MACLLYVLAGQQPDLVDAWIDKAMYVHKITKQVGKVNKKQTKSLKLFKIWFKCLFWYCLLSSPMCFSNFLGKEFDLFLDYHKIMDLDYYHGKPEPL